MQNLLQVRLEQVHTIGDSVSMVHFVGRFIACTSCPANAEVVANVLFDTGALCANYISQFKFEELREKNYILQDDIIWRKTCIGLADNATKVYSDKMLELPIQFQQVDGSWFTYTGLFVVLDMKENEVIIGLPAILKELWTFFVNTVEAKKRRTRCDRVFTITQEDPSTINPRKILTSESTIDSIHREDSVTKVINALEDLREPWAINPREECPEDKAVGLPVQFEWAQSFLGKPYEEAVAEYKAMFETHIGESMRKDTPIINLLETKGLDVFIPTTWEGITGFGKLALEFSSDLPARLKPKARHINPRMWEDAEKEFKRMRGYFYEESRSP